MLRFLAWGVIAALLVTYAVVRLMIGIDSSTVATIGFATFAAIEIVAAVWLAVGPQRRLRLILAHVLNGIGATLLSYASLQNEALLPNLIGAPFFVVGMALWAHEIQSRSVSLLEQNGQT